MEKVVITGGAGFIGSHLAAHFAAAGCEVLVIDDLSTGRAENLAECEGRVELRVGDVRDEALLDESLRGARWVLHEAAMVSVPRSLAEPRLCDEINAGGTLRVLEAARKARVERVTFAASAAAYGRCERLPISETEPPDPLSPYAATKLAGEHWCAVASVAWGMPCFPLRYFNVYGPRQDPSGPYSGVISKFVDCMSTGRAPTVFGDGSQTRDFVHVSDVVRANVAALHAPVSAAGAPINVGTGRSVSLIELIDALNRVLGTDLRPRFEAARSGDVPRSCAGIDRARERIGFSARTGLDAGLADLLRSHGVSVQR